MNQRLMEAASSGLIDALYSIIQEDAYVLDHIDQVPFVDTPLHISAAAGHIHFSLEIMRLKPSFAKKLNPEGYSPMHLALKKDQTETIFRLLDIDKDLVSVKGREGLTPLHIAASGGKADILTKLLVSCPKSIEELTIRRESALHIAVKNGDLESLKVLLEWIQQTGMTTVLNWTDDEGNNIMHLAALKIQIEVLKFLIKRFDIDMISENSKGQTVLDIMKDRGFLEDKELMEMLYGARVLKESGLVLSTLAGLSAFFWMILSFFKRLILSSHHQKSLYMSKEDRNAILVVSVLVATATYQVVLAPPDKDLHQELYTHLKLGRSYFSIVYICFRHFNTLAFLASMIEIYLHLPSGIVFSLHLVLPLVICYILLMLFWWSYSTPLVMGIVIFVFLLSKIPIVLHKRKGDLKTKQL